MAITACGEPDLPTAPTAPVRDVAADLSSAAPTIAVTHPSVRIVKGRGILLGATVLDPATTAQAKAAMVWKSSNPSVATVGSSTGQVFGIAPGTATITASSPDQQLAGTSIVTVIARPNCKNPAPVPPNVSGRVAPLPAGHEDVPMMVRLVVADDPDPCHRYTFRITELPISGDFYQVSEDGIPQRNAPLTVGAVVANSEGWITYVPDQHFNGIDAFRYDVRNQNGGGYGFMPPEPFYVHAVNDPPVALVTTNRGQNNYQVTNAVAQAIDVEGTAYTVCITELPKDGDLYWGQVTPPNRVARGDCRPERNLRYLSRVDGFFGCGPLLPRSAYPRVDTFQWNANDGASLSDVVVGTIQIDYQNLPPVFGGPGRIATTEDTPVNFTPLGTDPDGNLAYFVVHSPPANGSLWHLDPGQPPSEITLYPTAVLAGTTIQYQPRADFHTLGTSERLLVDLTDGDALPTCSLTIDVDVAPVNDAPIISAPSRITAFVGPGGIGTPSTFQVGIADDALPTDVLTVTLRAQGPAAAGVDLADPTGFPVVRISPTELQVSATVAGLNTLLGRGVSWTPNGSGAVYGELAITADDAGSVGAGGVMIGTRIVPVDVAFDNDGGLERVQRTRPVQVKTPSRRPRPTGPR